MAFPSPELLDPVFIFGARYAVVAPVMLAAFYFSRQPALGRKRLLVYGLLTGLVSLGLAKILGLLYPNPRPFVVDGITPLIPHDPTNGMPSNHTLLCAVIAMSLTPFATRLAAVLWLLALWVGYSRVYVGVHHLLDIFMSMVIAISVGTSLYLLLRRR